MPRKHINDDGDILRCSTTPDNCDFSRNGDHLEPNASDAEIITFHRQAEKVAERAAGQQSAVGSGSKRKATTKERFDRTMRMEELEDQRNEERARAAREEYLSDNDRDNDINYITPSTLTDADNTYLNDDNVNEYPVIDAGAEKTEAYMGATGFTGTKVSTEYRLPKEIAADMNEDYRQAKKDGALPKDARIGIRSTSAGMVDKIDVRAENLDEKDVYQYGYAKANSYAVMNRNLDRPALSLYQERSGPGTVADNMQRVHDSYNYSDSNAQVDYFNRGYYGSVGLSTKLEASQKKLESAKKSELKASSVHGYGSEQWKRASAQRIKAEDAVKDAAHDRANRIAAYRKQHILDTTLPGSSARTQGGFKLAMAEDGPFSESNSTLKPMVLDQYDDFHHDEVSFNHKPFGPEGLDKVEEAPHGRPVKYADPFGSNDFISVGFGENGRTYVRDRDGSHVHVTPTDAASAVKKRFEEWKEEEWEREGL